MAARRFVAKQVAHEVIYSCWAGRKALVHPWAGTVSPPHLSLGRALFNTLLEAEVRKVRPSDYCLFQAADMFCTLELARKKMEDGNLSKSEDLFFRGWRNLRKNYLKSIERKRL